MLRVYFHEVRTGRLGRLHYLGYWLAITIVGLLVVLLFVAASSLPASIIDYDMKQFEQALEKAFEGWMVVPTIAVAVLLGFAELNITAKRLRDIGLPGWSAVIVLTALTIAFYVVFSLPGGDLFSLLVWIALLAVPSNAMKRAKP